MCEKVATIFSITEIKVSNLEIQCEKHGEILKIRSSKQSQKYFSYQIFTSRKQLLETTRRKSKTKNTPKKNYQKTPNLLDIFFMHIIGVKFSLDCFQIAYNDGIDFENFPVRETFICGCNKRYILLYKSCQKF